VTYLQTFKSEDFAGAEERRISRPWMQGKWLPGSDYVTQLALPNFYFHVNMAYAILRHNGVDLGKIAYIGSVSLQSA